MHIDRWKDIIANIKDNFQVEDSGKEHIEDEGGVDIEYIVFTSSQGKFRLEFVSKPIILDKKTTFSKRIGSETSVEYVYSDTEKNQHLIAYNWSDSEDTWQEIDAKSFS